MTENYRVGQVLYVIPTDNAAVVPVQIMERRTSETSNGIVVRHIVKSAKAAAKPLVLETIKGNVFADLKHVREIMIRNATNAIDGMVKHAHNIAQQAFAPKQQAPDVQDELDPLMSGDVFIDDSEMVLQQPAQTMQLLPPPQAQSHVQPSSNGHSIMPDVMGPDGLTDVMGPDGKTQRVRLKVG